MMDDETEKHMRAVLEREPPQALETVREFLLHHVHSSDRDRLERQARHTITANPNIPIDAIEAIEQVFATPYSQALCELVLREGNHPLAERTDNAARSGLRQLARDLRAWLGDYAPPPRSGVSGAR